MNLVPVLSDSAAVTPVRPHTHTTYDQGAPNNDINPTTNTSYWLVRP